MTILLSCHCRGELTCPSGDIPVQFFLVVDKTQGASVQLANNMPVSCKRSHAYCVENPLNRNMLANSNTPIDIAR